MQRIVELGLTAGWVYLALGGLVAAALHLRGLVRLDPGVAGAGWLFRLLVTPGIVALWPFLLWRWRAARGGPCFGAAEWPLPARGIRAGHRAVTLTASILVPVALVLGVSLRPPATVPETLPAGLEPTIVRALGPRQRPFDGVPLSVQLQGDDSGRRQLVVELAESAERPALALFHAAGSIDDAGQGALLGYLGAPGVRRFDLAADGGTLVLYSLRRGERIGDCAVSALRVGERG